MDKGQNLAIGTKEELKKMIKKSEIIRIDVLELTAADLEGIRQLPHVYQVDYDEHQLTVLCNGGKHNLIRVLGFLQERELAVGHVYSEQPTLNDVFLEITGKELRD
jgi:ABC-2 type transport system ATP-binding protein